LINVFDSRAGQYNYMLRSRPETVTHWAYTKLVCIYTMNVVESRVLNYKILGRPDIVMSECAIIIGIICKDKHVAISSCVRYDHYDEQYFTF